jgi:acyl-coenzyme A thioesterase PaaI-like protein
MPQVAPSTPPDGTRARRPRAHWKTKALNFYPPFLGAGIRVRRGTDGRSYDVRMKLSPLNRNFVGTHFGGSLYAMCDPFFMLILIPALGRDYVVWDKAAAIRFLRPGRGTVRAAFHIPEDRIEEIRRSADADGKAEPLFTVRVLDETGETVAEVEKTLYVRRRHARHGN